MLKDNNNISISTGSFIRAALVVLSFALLWFLKDFLLIILASIIIASFVESIIPYFKKIHINRIWAVVICYFIALSFISGLIYLFFPLLISEIIEFFELLEKNVSGSQILDYFPTDNLDKAKNIVNTFSQNISFSDLLVNSKAFFSNLTNKFILTLSTAFGSLVNFVLIILISFYFSIEEEGIDNFLRVISPGRYENYIVDLWKRARRKIALWIKGQILLGILVAILIYLILSLLKIKYALLLSILVGIMNIVPYGTIIAMMPAIAVSYFSGGPTTAFTVALAYIIINQFENFLFAPVIIKGTVGLSPLVVLLSALIGFELNGIWGMVLGIPFTVILVEFFTDVEKKKLPQQHE